MTFLARLHNQITLLPDSLRAGVLVLSGVFLLGLSDNLVLIVTDQSGIWQFHAIRSLVTAVIVISFAKIIQVHDDLSAMKTNRELDILMPVVLAIQTMVADLTASFKVEIEWQVENGLDIPQPEIAQTPELSYALEAILENASDFAETKIIVDISWDHIMLYIKIMDDGIGYPTPVLANLGQPENSSRLGQKGHRGLGLFLVQSFIRQLNGTTSFKNQKPHGAAVEIKIPIESLV